MPREFVLFWNLCLLRQGPEEVPYSTALAWLVCAAWACVAVPLVVAVPGMEGTRALLFVAANAATGFVIVFLLLAWRGFRARLVQTVTALFGADLMLNLASLPVVLPYAGRGTPPGFAVVLQLLLFGWSITVKGHILRSALELPRYVAWTLALVAELGTMALMGALFTDLPAAPAAGHG